LGPDALLDTVAVLAHRGVWVIGAGANLTDARRPALVDRHGVRLAFLAYCSILRDGSAATADQPGVAPLRVRTSYEPKDYQPGVPPQILSVVDEDDRTAMLWDIRTARQSADAVVLSLHWGVHLVSRLIAEYQPEVAKAAFDAGADLILGRHAHVQKVIAKRYGIAVDPDYPHLAYGSDAKRSLIVKARLSPSGMDRVGFLPVLIDKQLRPEILRNGHPRFEDMVNVIE
jgi:poly-gamma-glutamate capsule biosynthesis protein CapA/YwtB (metallophosphatase superfamily)